MGNSGIPASVIEELAALFRRNGYVRPPVRKRLAVKGRGHFHRGFEFRLTADSRRELRHIRRLLRQAKFKPGHSFAKASQYRQPVYGLRPLERFLELIGEQDA